MKTLLSFFTAAFLLFATTTYAQQQASVFEKAVLAKAGDGLPCVQLNWKKGTENTAYYLVERSADGKNFKQIALVFTSENPAFCNYKFRDKGYTESGNNVYYRIAIVNDQKELQYLPVKKADLSSTAFSVSPLAAGTLARLNKRNPLAAGKPFLKKNFPVP